MEYHSQIREATHVPSQCRLPLISRTRWIGCRRLQFRESVATTVMLKIGGSAQSMSLEELANTTSARSETAARRSVAVRIIRDLDSQAKRPLGNRCA